MSQTEKILLFSKEEDFYEFLLTFNHKENKLYKCPDRYCKTNNIKPNLYQDYELANQLISNCKKFEFVHIERTPSGAIMRHRYSSLYGAYDIKAVPLRTNAEIVKGYILTILYRNKYWKFSFGSLKSKTEDGGFGAWCRFKEACEKNDIDLERYKIDNGEEVKAEIKAPMIQLFSRKRLQHVNHLDFHAAYPSVIIDKYPEFKPVFDSLRKPLGDIAVGYMQSKYINYQYAHLAKLAVNAVVDKITFLHFDLEMNGFEVVCHNTDGIWYYDKTGKNRLYHNEEEGHGYGKWEHDHLDCEFQGFSDRQYFYYENDKFNPVLSGYYKKDIEKPREEWTENDFLEAVMSKQHIYFDKDKELFILME